jgi:hypothetical protein
MVRGLSSELEGSSSAPPAGRVAVLSITGDPGKWQAAERKSEGVIVVMTAGTT